MAGEFTGSSIGGGIGGGSIDPAPFVDPYTGAPVDSYGGFGGWVPAPDYPPADTSIQGLEFPNGYSVAFGKDAQGNTQVLDVTYKDPAAGPSWLDGVVGGVFGAAGDVYDWTKNEASDFYDWSKKQAGVFTDQLDSLVHVPTDIASGIGKAISGLGTVVLVGGIILAIALVQNRGAVTKAVKKVAKGG